MARPRMRSSPSSLIRAPTSSEYANPRPARRRRQPGPLTSLRRSLTPLEWAPERFHNLLRPRGPPSRGRPGASSAELHQVAEPADLEDVTGHASRRGVDDQLPALVPGDAGDRQHDAHGGAAEQPHLHEVELHAAGAAVTGLEEADAQLLRAQLVHRARDPDHGYLAIPVDGQGRARERGCVPGVGVGATAQPEAEGHGRAALLLER